MTATETADRREDAAIHRYLAMRRTWRPCSGGAAGRDRRPPAKRVAVRRRPPPASRRPAAGVAGADAGPGPAVHPAPADAAAPHGGAGG